MPVATVDKNGNPGMPTFNIKKVRHMLKTGRAEIWCHRPVFTIRILDKEWEPAEDVELCVDAGAAHIGISIKSKKHEFVHAQYDRSSH